MLPCRSMCLSCITQKHKLSVASMTIKTIMQHHVVLKTHWPKIETTSRLFHIMDDHVQCSRLSQDHYAKRMKPKLLLSNLWRPWASTNSQQHVQRSRPQARARDGYRSSYNIMIALIIFFSSLKSFDRSDLRQPQTGVDHSNNFEARTPLLIRFQHQIFGIVL